MYVDTQYVSIYTDASLYVYLFFSFTTYGVKNFDFILFHRET